MSFRFKQFEIKQDKTAMKVGTDGVLLAAWANCKNAKTIFDIGSGTGLISIILAQRNQTTKITGIEIEEDAFLQSLENTKLSLWADRIEIKHNSLQEFQTNGSKKFDLIISNPPFFTNSQKAPEIKRNLARHNDTLSFENLIKLSEGMLNLTGIFSVIIPLDASPNFIVLANKHNLFLSRKTIVKPNFKKPPKRVLLEFSKKNKTISENELTIEIERHVYTKEYINLTKEFYIKM